MAKTVGIAVGCAGAYIILVVGLMIYCKGRRARQAKNKLGKFSNGDHQWGFKLGGPSFQRHVWIRRDLEILCGYYLTMLYILSCEAPWFKNIKTYFLLQFSMAKKFL